MDLGEAYLKAQQTRIESLAASAQAKTRCELVIALSLQGKTAEEIADFLKLTGL
jgi:DNA-binding CsgD family transcriptional regulator